MNFHCKSSKYSFGRRKTSGRLLFLSPRRYKAGGFFFFFPFKVYLDLNGNQAAALRNKKENVNESRDASLEFPAPLDENQK